jgi:hypothetical protein
MTDRFLIPLAVADHGHSASSRRTANRCELGDTVIRDEAHRPQPRRGRRLVVTVRQQDYKTRKEYRWAKKQDKKRLGRATFWGRWLIFAVCFGSLPVTHNFVLSLVACVVLQFAYQVWAEVGHNLRQHRSADAELKESQEYLERAVLKGDATPDEAAKHLAALKSHYGG